MSGRYQCQKDNFSSLFKLRDWVKATCFIDYLLLETRSRCATLLLANSKGVLSTYYLYWPQERQLYEKIHIFYHECFDMIEIMIGCSRAESLIILARWLCRYLSYKRIINDLNPYTWRLQKKQFVKLKKIKVKFKSVGFHSSLISCHASLFSSNERIIQHCTHLDGLQPYDLIKLCS